MVAPADPNANRTGRCLAVPRCRRDCTELHEIEGRPRDGFALCLCGHTKAVHALVVPAPAPSSAVSS